MKTSRLLVPLFTALFALLLPRPAEARVEVSFDFFYESLAPYGEWVEVGGYGYCWRPTEVDRDWTPYADGYWAFTDAGWTWVSYEDFGGIVYHYGRWVRAEEEGWCWVPDYEWGPAWVSWRNNDDYVGWAPLPPEARWQPSVGLSVWVDRVYDIGPGSYSFCHTRDFGAPVLRPVIINRGENVTIIRRTVNITNITYNTNYGNGPVIYNGGPNYQMITQRSSRRVPSLKLVQSVNINLPGSRDWDRDRDRGDRDGRRRNFNAEAVGNQLIVCAPGVKPPVDPGFLRSKVKKVIAADQVTRGWNGVKNEEVRRELKQEMQRQTRGLTPETAPARAVVAADLKVLPERADPRAASPVATRDQRDRPDRNAHVPEVAGQPVGRTPGNGSPRAATAPVTVQPRASEESSPEKTARKSERGQSPNEPQKPAGSAPVTRPLNPTEIEQKPRVARSPASPAPDARAVPRNLQPVEDPRMRDAERQAEVSRQRQQEQAAAQQKALASQQNAARRQAEAAAQQRQMETQRQVEGMRQQQKEEAAAVARQRMQAEQGRAARQQAEAAAAQQKQADGLRRQAVEQQRGQREPAQAAGQVRRAQETQREQVRPQQPQPRATQPAPNAPRGESEKDGRGNRGDRNN